tara:strand:+ start:1105 stop:1956 length:852 start_codon:yes stop_codon:yes gene_type:complete
VCDSKETSCVRKSNLKNQLNPDDFKISNKDYGKTLNLFKCNNCGFLFSPDISDLEQYYEQMEDSNYEDTMDSRKLQSDKILKTINKNNILKNKSLFDVGAGSGVLIEASIKYGLSASGIEPSKSLYSLAKSKKLDIHLGTFPSPKIKSKYDFVTLIDVIEHVNNPKQLLIEINKILKNKGKLFLVTPDLDSFFSRLLKYKWWHFRIAHIGYFNKKTIKLILAKTGFKINYLKRSIWYFPISYIINRLLSYISPKLEIKIPKRIDFIIPLNLYDSFIVECEKLD